MLSALNFEFRHALRSLSSQFAFSALVVGVLASGLACVIFMLVMIDGFVLRPLPFAEPERLLHAGVTDGSSSNLDSIAGRDLVQLRRLLAGKAEVAGFQEATVNLSDIDRPERFDGAMISANLWPVLGVVPLLGRDFTLADERPGAAPVVLLSYELWQSRYNGDPQIVGRQVRVNTRDGTVVGVMPKDLSYPRREQVWIPATLDEATKPESDEAMDVVLRRATTSNPAAISALLESWLGDAAKADPDRFRGLRTGLEPLAYMSVNQTTRTVLNIMLAAVVFVLLIACANAANLLLLRTLRRRQELALRIALGASRTRVVTHLLVQSLLLTGLAVAIALPLARAGMYWQEAALRESPNGPPHWLRFELDLNVILLSIGVAVFTALVTGLLPALRAARDNVSNSVRDGTRGSVSGSFVRLSKILVVGEVALSCALLIVVGTMVRGIVALDRLDLGFDSTRLLTARIGLFTATYPTGADQMRLYEAVTERLRKEADVVEASAATLLPQRFSSERDVVADGTPVDGDAALPKVRYGAVDDHFLATYGLRLLQGRFFDQRDRADGERVAVVDRRFVERYGAGGEVIGRRFHLDPRTAASPIVTVIGVVSPIKVDGPGQTPVPALLAPLRQDPARFVSLVVQVRGEPAAFAPRLSALMREVDADTPLYWVRDYAAVMRDVTFGEHVVAQWFSVFGLIALVLAAAGLYGVTAFSVSQRTREIGVRRALGAPTAKVLRSLFARTSWQLGLGSVAGLLVGIPIANNLAGTLHSINGGDAATPLLALAVLAAAAGLAVVVPARRALRVDPTEALRYE